jgi:hypothetical protein
VVRFSAEISPNSPSNICWIRAMINGGLMFPTGSILTGNLAVFGTREPVSLSWAQTVQVASQTTHFVQIQIRTSDPNVNCFVHFWQLEVERRD